MNVFLKRLISAVNEKKTALVVGLDPDIEKLPKFLLTSSPPSTRAAFAACLETYIKGVIDLIRTEVAVVKFQSACYEYLGGMGILVLERLLQYATDSGLIVILDGKRGDVPSTARLYAEAYLGKTSRNAQLPFKDFPPFQCDGLTVHPYLGMDSLEPFLNTALVQDKGIFVCVKTSNPGSGDFQDLKLEKTPQKKSSTDEVEESPYILYEHVAKLLREAALQTSKHPHDSHEEKRSHEGYSPLGIVVGATYPEQGRRLRELFRESCFLIPGWGHQGGDAGHFKNFFGRPVGSHFRGVLFNVSRGILTPTPPGTTNKDSADKDFAEYWKARTGTEEQWKAMISEQIHHYKTSLDTIFH